MSGMSLSSEFTQEYAHRLLPMLQAKVFFLPDFLSEPEAGQLFQALLQKADWRQEKIKLFGKEVNQPRLTAWYSNAGKAYTYSGLTWQPQPWLPELNSLRQKLEAMTGASFNSVLLNLYRHGQDSMGWHSDDEPELGQNPTIASVSLGSTRYFSFRHRMNKNLKERILLPMGSLLLMAGETQHFWQHQLAKTARELSPRINLTFRFVR